MDWHKEPLSDFIKIKFLPSIEGSIFTGASIIYLILVALAFVNPSLVALKPELFAGFAIIFLSWPIILFVTSCFVLSSNNFHSTPFSLVWVCGWSLAPFWVWYG